MTQAIQKLIRSEKEFLELKGNFTETVRLKFYPNDHKKFNGRYVYEKTNSNYTFVRKGDELDSIYLISCDIKYLSFDKEGVFPNSFNYNFHLLKSSDEGYGQVKKRLESIDEWKTD
ncbi:MAG: hypothetical protein ACOYT4_00405 [Nanoarchaeota archaeon]